ncbi:MAG: hypothetical protein M3475_08255 [Actinomycetota bacterium]|nr:hypothetical protein [Actinomycetota bacterium]
MITRQGKQYVLFAGLLDEAHSRGLRGIDTDLIQVPDESNGNVAVVKATVEMEDGRTFSGIGDASPANVGRNIVPHVIRMAETRAKARALRDAVNVGSTALEELSDGDDAPPSNSEYRRPTPVRESAPETARKRSAPNAAKETAGRPRPVEATAVEPAVDSAEESSEEAAQASNGQAAAAPKRSGKARKSQVELLKTLAVEWAGEGGVGRLEKRIGKSLADLTRDEADDWIDRITPKDRE